MPDREAAAETLGPPWGELDERDSVDSTNLEAMRRPEPWRVVTARHQSAGRGRLSRRWDSPAGLSTAVSCVVPVPADRPADWGWLPLLTGLAVRSSIQEVAGVATGLKWPNDVLAVESPGKEPLKLAGILCELVPGGGLAVVGAGTNVAQHREQLPVPTATSLLLCGATSVDAERLVRSYLTHLAAAVQAWLEGGAALATVRTAYRAACLTVGADVAVLLPTSERRVGRATGVDDAGRLEVRTADGRRELFAAGDVVHLRDG